MIQATSKNDLLGSTDITTQATHHDTCWLHLRHLAGVCSACHALWYKSAYHDALLVWLCPYSPSDHSCFRLHHACMATCLVLTALVSQGMACWAYTGQVSQVQSTRIIVRCLRGFVRVSQQMILACASNHVGPTKSRFEVHVLSWRSTPDDKIEYYFIFLHRIIFFFSVSFARQTQIDLRATVWEKN